MTQVKKMAAFWKVFPDVLTNFPTNVNLVVSFGPTRHDTVYRGNYLHQDQVKPVTTSCQELSAGQVAISPKVQFPLDG